MTHMSHARIEKSRHFVHVANESIVELVLDHDEATFSQGLDEGGPLLALRNFVDLVLQAKHFLPHKMDRRLRFTLKFCC